MPADPSDVEAASRRLSGPSRRITIGVLSDDVSNGYSEPILAELSAAARERGVALVNFVEWLSPGTLASGRRLTTDLAGPDSVDAILLMPIGYDLSADDLGGYCARLRPLPICSIPEIAGDFCSRISVDNEPGMRAGVTHLVETHGYTRIGFVRGPERSDEADLRYRVYREVLEGHGIAVRPEWVAPGNYVIQDGIDAVRRFFDESKLELEAIVCANDGMALGVLEALAARNIAVPEGVAVLGFDDVDIARYLDPPLTTVRQPLHALGRAALDLLLRQLASGGPPERTVLPSELVVRESCGCVSYPDGRGSSQRLVAPGPESGVEELARAAPEVARGLRGLGIPGAPPTDWPETLFQAFVKDIARGESNFLDELRRVLDAVGSVRGDVGGFHKVLTAFWRNARRSLVPGSREWQRADILLHAARASTSGIAEHIQSSRQVRFEDFAYKLTRTGNALGLAMDLAGLGDVLASDLALYGIPAAYVCLYEGERGDEARARLVAGCNRDGRLELPADGVVFGAGLVVPGTLRQREESQYVVGPLARSGESPGYAVFARGPIEGFVYESLLAQIGGAVKRIALLDRLLKEAALREAAELRRMEGELAIATRIQTGILPHRVAVEGLDIAAVMLPASEVGGDYYDIVPVAGGCWLGIGDVAGHGLPTGLVMLMLQSVASGLFRTNPGASPKAMLEAVNAVLFENIRERMAQDEHVTLTLLRYESSGRLVFAGAHEDILIYRARERRCEWIPTPGTWVGAVRNIGRASVDTHIELEPDDVMLLYTDGVTEAQNPSRERFGPDRLAESLLRLSREPVDRIRDTLVAELGAWNRVREDDITLLVARQLVQR